MTNWAMPTRTPSPFSRLAASFLLYFSFVPILMPNRSFSCLYTELIPVYKAVSSVPMQNVNFGPLPSLIYYSHMQFTIWFTILECMG
ncbi:hypothetical protein EV127DRAFT_446557 [Xylaria flabelliformis]|nr:hypothetical protein EV127DRAFT_446557 [Xylaria flabelliformis]